MDETNATFPSPYQGCLVWKDGFGLTRVAGSDIDPVLYEDRAITTNEAFPYLPSRQQAPERQRPPEKRDLQNLAQVEDWFRFFFWGWDHDRCFELSGHWRRRRHSPVVYDEADQWEQSVTIKTIARLEHGMPDDGDLIDDFFESHVDLTCLDAKITQLSFQKDEGANVSGVPDYRVVCPGDWFEHLGPNTQRFLVELMAYPVPTDWRLAREAGWHAAKWGPLPVDGPLSAKHPWLNTEAFKGLEAQVDGLPHGGLLHAIGPAGSGLSTALQHLLWRGVKQGAVYPFVLDFSVDTGHPPASPSHLDAVLCQQDPWGLSQANAPHAVEDPSSPYQRHAESLQAAGHRSVLVLEGLESLGEAGIAMLIQRLKPLLWAEGAPIRWCVLGWKGPVVAPAAWDEAAPQPCPTEALPAWDASILAPWHGRLPQHHTEHLDLPSAQALLEAAGGKPKAFLQAWKAQVAASAPKP